VNASSLGISEKYPAFLAKIALPAVNVQQILTAELCQRDPREQSEQGFTTLSVKLFLTLPTAPPKTRPIDFGPLQEERS
jgi:hypothetical protein